jgi:heme exporter protein A
MNNYSLRLNSVSKYFGRRIIFKNIDLTIDESGIYGISGPNGAGKSTLVKIIAGILSPSTGKIIHSENGREIKSENLHNFIGFVSPYLVLYDEFTAEENIHFLSDIRGINVDKEKLDNLFVLFKLADRRKDLMKTFSSGMKQRMKFIFALIHSPQLILLDEPTSNLDDEGKETIYNLIKKKSETNIVVIASNEGNDLSLCKRVLNINDYRKI